jgi:hypothetical protein
MPKREALVVACPNNSYGELKFLPELAQRVFQMLISPDRGNCDPLHSTYAYEPIRADFETAFFEAFSGAADRHRDLIVYFIGHGHQIEQSHSFYLVCKDSRGNANVVDLSDLAGRAFTSASHLRRLTIIIDACFSGGMAASVASKMVGQLSIACMAAVAEGKAYNGCFSQALLSIVENGIDGSPEDTLGCEDLYLEIARQCSHQLNPLLSSAMLGGLAPYVARNVRAPSAGELGIRGRPLPEAFQPTATLRRLADLSQHFPLVRVVGSAGTGKTTLARALAEPKGILGFVPQAFVDAVAFLDSIVTPGKLADHLSSQLKKSSFDFARCAEDFELGEPEKKKLALSPLQRRVIKPSLLLPETAKLRIVITGLHLLRSVAGQAILKSLDDLAKIPQLRLVVLSEPFPEDPLRLTGTAQVLLGEAENADVERYLDAIGIGAEGRQQIVADYEGNWEKAVRLADRWRKGDGAHGARHGGIREVYLALLEERDLRYEHWVILGIFAAAGPGPVVPLPLLRNALSRLKASLEPDIVRGMLNEMMPFVGSDANGEVFGLTTPAISDVILEYCDSNLGLKILAFENVLADAVAEAVPKGRAASRDALFRYAWNREPELLWNAERYSELIKSLMWRQSQYASEQLTRWQGWTHRLEQQPGPNVAETLFARTEVARLRLENLLREAQPQINRIQELRATWRAALRSLVQTWGLRQRESLIALAQWYSHEGSRGGYKSALRIMRAILVRIASWSPDDPDRLAIEYEEILWSRYLLRPNDAIELRSRASELRKRLETALGPNSRLALDLKGIIASLEAHESPLRAVAAYEELLQLQLAQFGPDSEDVLTTKHALVVYKWKAGQRQQAYVLSRSLIEDQIHYFGERYPETLETRLLVNDLAGRNKTSSAAGTRDALSATLQAATMILDPGAELTNRIRVRLAVWTARAGDYTAAVQLAEEVCSLEGETTGSPLGRIARAVSRTAQRRSDAISRPIISLPK